MAILTFPTITPDTQNFGIQYNTQVSTSELSGIMQTVELPGARWGGNMSFTDRTLSDSSTLKAFLLELRGASGTFFYADQSHTSPFNAVTGSPTVGAASTARFIRVTLGASSPQFSPGDYVQIGTDDQREYKMVISSTLVSGDTYDLVIEPMIRRTDYVGLSVVYTNPVGVFMLASDDQGSWGIRSKATLSDLSLDYIEVFL
jgi:hypothetical protein